MARVLYKNNKFSLFIIAALTLFIASCSALVSTSGFNQAGYKFLGVKKITASGGGTFLLEWDKIPKGTASYEVFVKEGSAADPTATSAVFDFAHPFTRVAENRFVTENVLLKYNVCYAVRLIYPKYIDKNVVNLCTNHTRFTFTGIESATAASDGVTLTWPSVPMSGMQYFIYESSSSGIYNYATPTKRITNENTYKSTPVSLGQNRCYVVRYFKEGTTTDTNSKEICVGETINDFAGIETATSPNTGDVNITWKSAGSIAKSYRIYQGVDFSKLLKTVTSDNTSNSLNGFTPGETYDLGVRVVDSNGREDSNTKTMSIKITDLSAPVFAGVSQLESTGSRSFKVKWTAAAPLPARYDIFVTVRDAIHADASLNCDLSSNSTVCRDLINWNNPSATATANALEYTFNNMGDDQSVFVGVRAISTSNVSDANIAVKRITIADTGAPQFDGLAAIEMIAGGMAKLTWNAPTGQVSNFRILTTLAGSTNTTTISAMLPANCTTACTDVVKEYTTPPLLSTTSYTFKVQAVDRNNAVDTNTVTRTVVTGDTTAPGVVTGVSAIAQNETSVSVSFLSPDDNDVNKYEVRFEKCTVNSGYSTTSPSCPGSLWGTKTLAAAVTLSPYTPATITNLLITALEARSVYRFYIRAVDSSNNAATEIAITKATLDSTPPQFVGVGSVAQNQATPTNVTVSWNSPGGDVSFYVIYRRKGSLSGLSLNRNAYPGDVQIQTVTEPTVSYDYSDLTTASDVWYFVVHAVDDQGNEDINAAQRSYTVPDLTAPVFAAGSTTAAWNAGQDGIVLGWTASSGASQYKIEAQCINTDGVGASGTWPGTADWPQTTNWIELATVGQGITSYKLPRVGSSGTCAGAEYRSYRFRIHAKKPTSDWDNNTTIKPGVLGATIPDLSVPTWPSAAALTGVKGIDGGGADTIMLTWPEALESYTNPVRSGSGIANYDIYLTRSIAPTRVLIKQNISGTLSSGNRSLTITTSDMDTACTAAGIATPETDAFCRFTASQSYTFTVKARDNSSLVSQELIQATPTTLSDTSPPDISSVSIPASVNDGSTFTVRFTSSENGTYRILHCATSGCGGTTVVLASGSMTANVAAVVNSLVLDSTESNALASGTGNKILAIELKDSLLNTKRYDDTTTPAIAGIYRYARPSLNISNFRIFKYNNAGIPTFRLSWTLPAGLAATDVIRIRKGTTSAPTLCTAGSAVADKTYTDTYHDIVVGSDTSGNISYSAFVMNTSSLCALGTTGYGVLWNLGAGVLTQSDGPTASYGVSTSGAEAASVKVAEARSLAKISAWTGNNTADVCVTGASGCGADGNLSNTSYFGVSTLSWTAATPSDTATFDYSNLGQHPLWSKRYHRFYFSNASATNTELTDVYTFGKAPPGMVYVAANSWPQNIEVTGSSPTIYESYATSATSGDWDAITHDFAIDKYETSLGSGTLASPTTFPNSETGVLISAAVVPLDAKSWNAHKQGCLNRSYDASYASYVATADLSAGTSTGQSRNSNTLIPNPRRKFHLATGIEWTVAAYGTPDQGGQAYCNIDSRGTPSAPTDTGTNSTTYCVSKFGARNMIGNEREWTDDWAYKGKRGTVNRFVGTLAEHSIASALLSPSAGTINFGSWNFRAAMRLPSTANVALNGDLVNSFYQIAASAIEGGWGYGVGWVTARDGSWTSLSQAGRFYIENTQSSKNSNASNGGRCTIVAPQPQPIITKFSSESDANNTKLSWITLDTEDSSTLKLASAATKAELDNFDGTNTPSGVTISAISVDATGKHVGAGGCEATYTPKAAGFESEINNAALQDNYWSGKYCAAASGTKYYKLCATNPSIAQVTDDYTTVQRTACSSVVAIEATLALPTFTAYSNAAKLQNDSDGPFARFYWNVSGGTNVVAKLVYGINIDEVKRWNGDSTGFNGFDTGTITSGVYYGTLSGVKAITVPAGNTRAGGGGTTDCDTGEYNGTTWGVYEPFTGANGISATHFACVNMSAYPKWTKMFFKVMLANTDGSGNITSGWVQSAVRGAGHVPNGMVYITREEWQSLKSGGEDYTAWPVCVGASGASPNINHIKYVMPGVTGYLHGTSGCVYDFAIDKYEGYLASGTFSAGTFNATNTATTDYNTSVSNASSTTPATSMAGNASDGILLSSKAKTAAYNINWFKTKKGCDNRTAQVVSAGFLTNNSSPSNNVRLPTGVEWTVAAYNTPDDGNANTTCNVAGGAGNLNSTALTSAGFNGTGGMVKCVSTFGSYDHIGNVLEWTDETSVGGTYTSADFYRMLGTSHATAFPTSGTGIVPTLITSAAMGGWVLTWDYLTGLATSITGVSGTSTYGALVANTVGPPAGGNGGANWAPFRGGASPTGATAGRFSLTMSFSPAYSDGSFGGRCSVLPP